MPTREQINRAAAQACGWEYLPPQYCERCNVAHERVLPWKKDGKGRKEPPDFCSDCNALPSLMEAVTEADKWDELTDLLWLNGNRQYYRPQDAVKAALTATPAQVTEAALKALGRWPCEEELTAAQNRADQFKHTPDSLVEYYGGVDFGQNARALGATWEDLGLSLSVQTEKFRTGASAGWLAQDETERLKEAARESKKNK